MDQVYRPRRPRESPLWKCLSRHFDTFLNTYEERYQRRYGFLRPIIPEVVSKFLDCGDLEQGFARIRCDHCKHEFILPFSCRQRYFCPSCHQKKVQLFGELLTETILYPVPHRHFTLGVRTSVTTATCSSACIPAAKRVGGPVPHCPRVSPRIPARHA